MRQTREEVPDEGAARRAEHVDAPAADRVVTQWDSATYLDLSPGGGRDHMLAVNALSPFANVKDRNNPNPPHLLAGPMPWTT